ncbi:MAG TPA: OmpH family outer membrane protein [Phycisphaerae bacterium]|nr:OmpH family outer membrane protein [Phycisphaerae bacterium]
MTRSSIKSAAFATGLLAALVLAAKSSGQPDSPPAGSRGTANSSASDCCIGIVDFVRIFNECEQIKDLNEALRKQEVDVQAEAKQRQDVIENKQVELSAFKTGSPDYQQRRKDLIRLGTEANVWLKVSEQDLENQKFDWTKVVYQKAVEVVSNLSRERGLKVVLQYKEFSPDDTDQTLASIRRMIQERAVVYAENDTDMTDEVIKRLNETYRAAGGKKQLEPSAPAAPASAP